MKKLFFSVAFLGVCLLSFILLSGCLKDKVLQTYKIYQPVFKTLTQVRAGMKSSTPQPLINTGKINLFGKYIFLSEVNKGIHVIDNSDPGNPKNIGFINVPGNGDLSVKGNYLYADSYSDMVVFDISDPQNVVAKKFINQIFPDHGGYYWGNTTNPDSVQVVVDYIVKDTTVDVRTYRQQNYCMNCAIAYLDAAKSANVPVNNNVIGISGSLSRFAIINNYLYGVSTSELFAFNIDKGDDPQLSSRKNVGNWSIETIYPFQNKLFIGSSNGMFIYDVSNPDNPSSLGQFSHVRSCDPVIADDANAFVTLRSGTQCQGFTNQLEVLNISKLTDPSLVKIYPMTNPHGLAKDGDLLFICDGKDGLKVYDAADVNNIKLLKTISDVETFDVIAQNGLAIVVANDGLYQFDYTNKDRITQLSKISLTK